MNVGDRVRSLDLKHAPEHRYSGTAVARRETPHGEVQIQVQGKNCPGIWFPEDQLEVLKKQTGR